MIAAVCARVVTACWSTGLAESSTGLFVTDLLPSLFPYVDCPLAYSASVRRSSMREKAAISWKEALEEGRRIRESSFSNDDDDEEERKTQATVPFQVGTSVMLKDRFILHPVWSWDAK